MASPRKVIWQIIPHLALGGATQVVLWLCQHLNREEFEIKLISGERSGREGSLREEAERIGVEIELLPRLRRDINPLSEPFLVAQLRRRLRREAPHLIHAHGSKAHIVTGLAARGTGVRTVFTAHGWPFTGHAHSLHNIISQRLLGLAMREAAAIVAVSEATRQKGLHARIGRPQQYHVIYPGADLERFAPDARARAEVRREFGLTDETVVAGSVMRLSPQKAPVDLILAAAHACRHEPRLRFMVIGSGPEQARVERAIKEHGLAERVLMLGTRRDVPRLIQAFDIFALSSLWEGLPIVYAEASAAGLPIAGTSVDGAAELVEDGVTGLLAPSSQPRQLAQNILRLAGDLPRARQMGQAARQKVLSMGFDVETIVRRHEELYRQVLGSERTAGTEDGKRGTGPDG